MLVKAKEIGFYGSLRAVGEEFEVADGASAKWFVPVEAVELDVPKKRARKLDVKGYAPETFAEIAKNDEQTV